MQRGVCFLLLILVLQGVFSPMCGMRVCAAEDSQAVQTDVIDAGETPDRAEEGDDLKDEVETLRAKLIPLGAKVATVVGWIAYDIVWDTAGQPTGLPTAVVIKDGNLEFDDVAKHLSQEYGCGVYSLGIRPLTSVSFKEEGPG